MISGKLVSRTTTGEHDNFRVNADSVLLVKHNLCVVLSDDVEDTSRNEEVDFKLEALSRLTARGSRAL